MSILKRSHFLMTVSEKSLSSVGNEVGVFHTNMYCHLFNYCYCFSKFYTTGGECKEFNLFCV